MHAHIGLNIYTINPASLIVSQLTYVSTACVTGVFFSHLKLGYNSGAASHPEHIRIHLPNDGS